MPKSWCIFYFLQKKSWLNIKLFEGLFIVSVSIIFWLLITYERSIFIGCTRGNARALWMNWYHVHFFHYKIQQFYNYNYYFYNIIVLLKPRFILNKAKIIQTIMFGINNHQPYVTRIVSSNIFQTFWCHISMSQDKFSMLVQIFTLLVITSIGSSG
jgi:hypothetical protein